MGRDKQEICTIRIMFSVESDEEAMTCKKKISEVLSDIEGVVINFSIGNMPAGLSAR